VVADPAIETIISKLVEAAGLLDTLIVLFVTGEREGREGRDGTQSEGCTEHRKKERK
jgi:hypothetical protein